MLELIRPRLDQVQRSDPQMAVSVMLATLSAALGQRALSFLPHSRRPVPHQSDETFIREMLVMSAAYLNIDRSESE